MKWNTWNRFLYNEAGDGGDGGGGAGGGGAAGSGAAGTNGDGAQETIIQSQGGGTESWFSGLPDDLKVVPLVQQFKDLPSFVKSAVETKSMVGANTIKLPGEKATPEERAEFYNKLGRPPEPGAYKPTVEPVNESLVDSAVMDKMKSVFHEAGLSAAQGQVIMDSYLGVLNDGFTNHTEAAKQVHEKGVATLKADWGQDYDNNVKTAQLAVRELGGENLLTKLADAGLGSDPDVLKFLHAAGTKLLDDSAVGDGGGQFRGTSEGALAEINRLKTDSEFLKIWGDAQAVGHKEAVQRWEDLHRQAYPGKQQENE